MKATYRGAQALSHISLWALITPIFVHSKLLFKMVMILTHNFIQHLRPIFDLQR